MRDPQERLVEVVPLCRCAANISSRGGMSPMSVIARIVKSRPRRDRRIGTSNATSVRDATTHSNSVSAIAIAISAAERRVVHEADERAAQRDERRERRDTDERRREHAGHELAAGAAAASTSRCGIERLVVAEPEDREHRPAEGREAEHDDREIGRRRVSPRAPRAP